MDALSSAERVPAEEREAVVLVMGGTHGPLFVVQESEAAVAHLAAHYPQFKKRGFGWCLSVEEVSFMMAELHPRGSIRFATAAVERQFTVLRQSYARECAMYAALTAEHGYRLRHGSQFGSSYIGYQDVGEHGECLLFAGPLTELERVRAERIARSVGKLAMLVTMDADDGGGVSAGVTVTPLAAASSTGAPRRRSQKSRRTGSPLL
ncbi:tRNA intron endonuclease, catalytic C-terminal domain containing protein [Novymonas esmeraldas]|uniref:tRNA intron endonuclease, catalytic C-terminal domain containing protein n=1 Tax=Novymonas esmeraldas TaxID=1808958 RepID=A0AAW0EUV0_9TRYP